MMILCNWLRRVFAQKTSSSGSTTGYRTTKEDFGIYPTQNRNLIFILRTTPHPCQDFRASEICRPLPPQHLTHTEPRAIASSHFGCIGKICWKMMLTILSNKLDFHGSFQSYQQSQRRFGQENLCG